MTYQDSAPRVELSGRVLAFQLQLCKEEEKEGGEEMIESWYSVVLIIGLLKMSMTSFDG